jgi:hypothetical protein
VKLTFIDPSAKFIGKLDDIPAFAEATRGEEEPEEEPEPEPEPEPDPEPEPEPEPEPPADVDAEPPEGEGGDLGEFGELPSEGDAEGGEEGTNAGGKPMAAKQGLGPVEYALIGLAVFVLIGLVGGAAFLFLGGDG